MATLEEESARLAVEEAAKKEAESLASSASKDVKETPAEIEKKEFLKRLADVNAKAEKAERALLKFQEVEDKRKKDELSELDRLKLEKQEAENKATQAQTELQTERERNSILAEASKPQFGDKKMKFCNPEIAYRLLTEDDKAKGIVSALQELAKVNPFLLETPAVAGDGVGSPRKGIKSSEEQKPPNYKIPHF